MRISLRWLHDYVDLDLEPRELAERLTLAGLEVDGVFCPGEALRGVVVGEVLRHSKHPNADRLSVCSVRTDRATYEVVCGAPNVGAKQKVAFAPPGTVLPGGLTITARKIRGVSSKGMILSEKELDLSEEAEGILVLSDSARVGASLAEELGLDDSILELAITPNRPDCLSHIGIAREVSALTDKPLRLPGVTDTTGEVGDPKVAVTIRAPEHCPRYAAQRIEGIRVAPSPAWLARRLEAVGVRPINNVVDVTNYVLMEFGQPLHAFDYDFLEGGGIEVRLARPGERMSTLDAIERNLTEDDLLICDLARPVALAGVMGGTETGISEQTTQILIESAYFNADTVRRTSKRHHLQSESSYRFERGMDPNGVLWALQRATDLVLELTGGRRAAAPVDCYPNPIEARVITLRPPRIGALLGRSVSAETSRRRLEAIGAKVREEVGTLRVEAPTYRPDLTEEVDLIEEIARLEGYESIPTRHPRVPLAHVPETSLHAGRASLRRILADLGFSEIVSLAFGSSRFLDWMRPGPDDPHGRAVRIGNPIGEEFATLRTSLLPGLLEAVRLNQSRGSRDLRLFEIGKVFLGPAEEGGTVEEQWQAAGVWVGLRSEELYLQEEKTVMLPDVRGVIENMLDRLAVTDRDLSGPATLACLHPEVSSAIRSGDRTLGEVGLLHPDVSQLFEFVDNVYVFDLNLALTMERVGVKRKWRPIARFPAVYRDLAIVVDEACTAGRAVEVVRGLGEAMGSLVREMRVFDEYRGRGIPNGKKGLAYRLAYQSDERTLTDEEVNRHHELLIEALGKQLGATLRD